MSDVVEKIMTALREVPCSLDEWGDPQEDYRAMALAALDALAESVTDEMADAFVDVRGALAAQALTGDIEVDLKNNTVAAIRAAILAAKG